MSAKMLEGSLHDARSAASRKARASQAEARQPGHVPDLEAGEYSAPRWMPSSAHIADVVWRDRQGPLMEWSARAPLAPE
jgi:hypothetical protein